MKLDLKNKRYILDGAMGTLMINEGMQQGEDSTSFALAHPDIIANIHRAYIDAGSDIIYSPTFNLNRAKAEKLGGSIENTVSMLMKSTLQVRDEAKANGKEVLAALDIGPQGDMMEPFGTLTFEDAYAFFADFVKAGVAEGADLVVIETMSDLYETKAAVLAAKENSNLPVIVSLSFEESGRTYLGVSIEAMAATLESLGVDAMGINCSLGPIQILPLIKRLMEATNVPVFAKPNAGLPDAQTGEYDISCDAFVDVMKSYFEAGVCMAGGCCGTTPEYIKGLAEYAKAHPAEPAEVEPVKAEPVEASAGAGMICSNMKAVALSDESKIGRAIDPAADSTVADSLAMGDVYSLLDMALQQADEGADAIVINCDAPGADVQTLLPQAVKFLQSMCDLPMILESASPQAMEAALRVYNGRPGVSMRLASGCAGDMEAAAAKYGALII